MMRWFRRHPQKIAETNNKDAELIKGDLILEELRQRVQRIRDTTKVVTVRAQSGKLQPER